ncbi:MAG: YdcF family protein [Eubacteriales bacterium]|nr:YdcF family protein [Eubacteriales bacterium]
MAIIIHNGFWQLDFSIFWVLCSLLLGGTAVLIHWEKLHGAILPNAVKLIIGITAAVFLLIAGVLGTLVVRKMASQPPKGLSYVIVLGAHVRGEVPSKALQKRIDRAYEYALENPDTILILSGGQGSGEAISEAECMRRCLLEMGVEEKRMVLEKNSTTTRENLLFSDKMTNCKEQPIGLISNDFHIYRALYIAKSLGFNKACGIAAPTDKISVPNYVVREIFALMKAWIINLKNTSA